MEIVSQFSRRTVMPLWIRRAWAFSRPLTLAVALHIALIPLLCLGMLLDPKVITGVNGWIKPFKFAVSGAVYCATLLWMLRFVDGKRRLVQAIATVSGLGLLVEVGLITMQVIRGVGSHFNVTTPFDLTIFLVMGGMVSFIAVANMALAAVLLIQRLPNPVVAAGLRWGLLASIVGMASGVLMATSSPPAPAQSYSAAAQPAVVAPVGGAHSIGVRDGGPGLPLVGWSTEGGDLRVGHFVGLHGVQLLPFIAFLLGMPWAIRRLSERSRAGLVRVAGASYTVLTGLLIWQALRAQPLIAPDALTLSVLALWISATAAAALIVIVHGRLAPQRRGTSALQAIMHPSPWL